MRTRTLTGVATAALGAVVVAGAGPALAQTTLTQGSAITAPAGAMPEMTPTTRCWAS